MPMSESKNRSGSTTRQSTLLVLGILGAIFLFAIILLIAYLPTRPMPVDQVQIEERRATLAEVEADQHRRAHTYGWIDEPNGIVRIPIERAVELTVRELSEAHTEK